MARRPFKALGTFTTPHGIVICRKVYSAKQGSWILCVEGPHNGLRLLLPDWQPRAPSTRTQLSPPVPTKKVSDILAFFQALLPIWYERLAGKPVPMPAQAAAVSYRTLGELQRLVERESAGVLRPGSLATYQDQWQAVLRVLDPGLPLTELTREQLQAAMNELGQRYASTTLKNIRTALRKLLIRAVEDGVLLRNPLQRVQVPPAIAKPKRMLSQSERHAVLAAAKEHGQDIHLACALMLLAGLRRREALALTWNREDVDLEHRILSIRNTEDFISKSGDAVRHIPIDNTLFEILSRAQRRSGFVLAPNKPYGGGRYRWNFTKAFAAVARNAGVPWLYPHLCRHCFASLYVEGGGTIFRLSRILGHSTAAVTELYLHLVPNFSVDEGNGEKSPVATSKSA